MRLSNEDFARFKELEAKIKAKKATQQEIAEFDDLKAMRNSKGSNDLSWWKNYPELTKDVVNLPFNWIPGTDIELTNLGGTLTTVDFGLGAIAGLAPAIGRSIADADAFNTQIRQLWVDMHRKYRGIGTYQKSDLGMAILAIHSLFETIAKFERIYGVINSYKIGNRVVPYGLKELLGIDVTLEENLADFRYYLNLNIEKCRQLCLPRGLSMLEADLIAQGNLFKDSSNRRAFIFGYDTNQYGVYDGSLVNTGGTAIGSAVKYVNFTNDMNGVTPDGQSAFTLSDIFNILTTQIDALLNDDDIQTMCSDLLAAYGPENVMTLQSVPENYKIEPVEDYERSLQFHNLTICGSCGSIYEDSVIDNTMANAFMSAGTPYVIYQHDNVIKCRIGKGVVGYSLVGGNNWPKFNTAGTNNSCKMVETLFDTWVDSPGETEIMCGTRYTSLAGSSAILDSTYSRQEIVAFGGKVVEDVKVLYHRPSGYQVRYFRGTVVDDAFLSSNIAQFTKITQMDWAPIFFDDDGGDLYVYGDVDNFTRIDVNNLKRLHEVAILSGYKIPMVSKE